MRQICVRETVYLPAEQPVEPQIELSLPPASWFRPEWYSARMEREAREQEIEEDNDTVQKWLRFVAWLVVGTGFVAGSMAAYLAVLTLIGTP